jgi:hypothetical protein
MSDDRDLCERLVDPRYDGSLALRIDAAREITRLQSVVYRLNLHISLLENQRVVLERHLKADTIPFTTSRTKSNVDD